MILPDGQVTVQKTQILIKRQTTDLFGASALLPIEINGTRTRVTVDTGAAVTIISTKLFGRIPSNVRPQLTQCEGVNLIGADGKGIAVDGKANVEISIGKQTFQWEVYVAQIQDDGLLGYDFLYYYDCAFEARRGVRIKGQWTACEVNMGPPKATRVTLAKEMRIPALTECVVEGCADFEGFGTQHGLVEPNCCFSANYEEYGNDDDDDLIIGSSLIDTKRQDIGVPIRVLNPTPEDILLFEGKTLGYVHEVDAVTHIIANEEHTDREISGDVTNYSVCSIHNQTADRNQNKEQETDNSEDKMASYSKVAMSTWNKDLRELYNRSSNGFNPDQQVERARRIDRYLTCFSTSPTDIGRSSILKHEINTGDAQPEHHHIPLLISL